MRSTDAMDFGMRISLIKRIFAARFCRITAARQCKNGPFFAIKY